MLCVCNVSQDINFKSNLTQKAAVKAKRTVNKSALTKENLELLLASGKKQKEICEILGIVRSTLVKYLMGFGIYTPMRKPSSVGVIVEREDLQEHFYQGKTLNELATYFNVSIGKIRYYLNKYNISKTTQEEAAVLKKYYSAKTPREREEAFVAVDKRIEKFAREELHLDATSNFEDSLQDLRLTFLELLARKEKGSREIPKNIFEALRKITKPVVPPELKTVELEFANNMEAEEDYLTKTFEENDLLDYLLGTLGTRTQRAMEIYLKENKKINQIAEYLGYATLNVKNCIKVAFNRMEMESDKILSDEYIERRADNAYKVVQDIINSNRKEYRLKKDKNYYRY